MAVGKRKKWNSGGRFRKRCKNEIHWITAVNIQVETFKEG